MMKKYSCIIVDDDEIDRLTVLSFAKKFPLLQVVGIFSSAEDAINSEHIQDVHILFLDIDMPNVSGLKLEEKQLTSLFAYSLQLIPNMP